MLGEEELSQIHDKVVRLNVRFDELEEAHTSWWAVKDAINMAVSVEGISEPHHAEDEVDEIINFIENELTRIKDKLELLV